MYLADQKYTEMKALEAQIHALEVTDAASVAEYFRLYTLLIYNYKWLGSIYDIYDSNAFILKGNGVKLNGAAEMVKNTMELLAAFPDLELSMADIFAVPNDKGYKLYRRFYLDGTNLGYSWYGAPTGKALEGKKAICQSMSTLEKVDGAWMITYEYTMYADEWIRQVCTPEL